MSVFTNSASSSPAEIAAYVSAVLGLIEGHEPLAVLRQTPSSLARTLEEIGSEAVRVPEAPGKWSVNEVLQHLADSEIVFSWRIRLVLAHDRPTITGYDQDRWADRLHYAGGDPQDAIERFRVVRRSNVQ